MARIVIDIGVRFDWLFIFPHTFIQIVSPCSVYAAQTSRIPCTPQILSRHALYDMFVSGGHIGVSSNTIYGIRCTSNPGLYTFLLRSMGLYMGCYIFHLRPTLD